MTVETPFVATVRYVKRDEKRDSTEKPYILHYAAPEGFPQNNFSIEPVHGIQLHNLRTAKLDYNEHGMAMATIDDSNLDADRFDDDDWVESVYLPRLHKAICHALGAKDMTVFDWMVRKRAPSFPRRCEGETNVDAHQPSLSAHIDYTEAELDSRLDGYFGAEKEKMLNRHYQVIKCVDWILSYDESNDINRP
jgi:hypothetical protein